jgi:hypothetical protein
LRNPPARVKPIRRKRESLIRVRETPSTFYPRAQRALSVVALDGFLEESALGPVVKDGALTRERFRITPQYFVANNSGQAARFSSMLV